MAVFSTQHKGFAMIESKTLGSAAGVQYQGVIDNSESTDLPSLANGVITGSFKRGRMDKPFKVTASTYQALLGRDPSNPSYLVVEDAFKRGISEVSILRTGDSAGEGGNSGAGGISCTPSMAIFSKREINSLEQWITVSRNGGEFKTFDLNGSIQNYMGFIEMAYTGQDGETVAFIDYPSFLSGNNPITEEPPYQFSVTGISTNGIISTYAGDKDLKSEPLSYPTAGVSASNKPRAEHNWLVFKPTPNVDPDDDLFYRLGATGDTLEIHSCAVMEREISTCTPKSANVVFNPQSSVAAWELGSQLHAKYRVNNGEWINYTASAGNYNPVMDFFNSIKRSNGQAMIETAGNSFSVAPFRSYQGRSSVIAAAKEQPYSSQQSGVITDAQYDIEFVVTENNINDLVYLAFGGNTTIHSCAMAEWIGL